MTAEEMVVMAGYLIGSAGIILVQYWRHHGVL